MKNNITLFFSLLLLNSGISFAQVGINTQKPNASLDITRDSIASKAQGVLIPRMTLAQLIKINEKYKEQQHGIMIQITAIDTVMESTEENQPDAANITIPGYYSYNATLNKWQIKNTESWKSLATGNPAIQSDTDIYKDGRVSVGNNAIHSSAKLEVSSANGGFLIPRLTTDSRNNIQESANGLMIYNVTTNCFNYFDQSTETWLSLCGESDPAEISITSCNNSDGVGPNPTLNNGDVDYHLQQGIALTADNTYTLQILVATTGPYTIRLESNNGYSYSASGEFYDIGLQNIILIGEGGAIEPSTGDGDPLKLFINQKEVTPDCTLPKVKVLKDNTALDLECPTQIIELNNYTIGEAIKPEHAVTLRISNISTTGNIRVISTHGINNTGEQSVYYFDSDNTSIEANSQSIVLYLRKNTSNSSFVEKGGIFKFKIKYYNSSNVEEECEFEVKFESSFGTYEKPDQSCLVLYQKGMTEDGYYWLTTDYNENISTGTLRYKTYCDMTNGGWTLISSVSEKNYKVRNSYEVYDNQVYRNLRYTSTHDGPFIDKSVVDREEMIFNEYDFLLQKSKVQSIIGSGVPLKNLRITIKEKGHTTEYQVSQNIIEATTVSPSKDIWSTQNFWEIETKNNLLENTYQNYNYYKIISSKIFGLDYEKSGYTNYYKYNNSSEFKVDHSYLYNNVLYFGYKSDYKFSSQTIDFDYPEESEYFGNSFTFDTNNITNLFGHWSHSHSSHVKINHHFLACKGEGDDDTDLPNNNDWAGETYCQAKWENWRPHRLNEILNVDGTSKTPKEYHGRIQQVWVK